VVKVPVVAIARMTAAATPVVAEVLAAVKAAGIAKT
jgi:hypothetical protein